MIRARTKEPKAESTPLGDKLRLQALARKRANQDEWAAGLAEAANLVDAEVAALTGKAFVDALDRMLAARLEAFVADVTADVVAAIHDTAAPAPASLMPLPKRKIDLRREARAREIVVDFQRPPPAPPVGAGPVAVGKKTLRALASVPSIAEMPPTERQSRAAMLRVLVAVAQHMPDGVDPAQLTVLTGLKKTQRDLCVRNAIAEGWLHKAAAGRTIRIYTTPAGVRELGPFTPLPTGAELLRYWIARLPEGERRVLELVVSFYPHVVSSHQITNGTGYQKTQRDLYVRKLRARKLLEPTGVARVQASPLLFDEVKA